MGKDNSIESAAHRMVEKGLSVIPVDMTPNPKDENKPKKAALVSWTEFQRRLPTDEEIDKWWKKFPNAGLGIVTGQLSNLTVIDTDTLEAKERVFELLPDGLETVVVDTPRLGTHFYFQHEKNLTTAKGLISGLDVRSEGGYVVCPPTPGYSWGGGGLFNVFDTKAFKMPKDLKDFIYNLYAYIGQGQRRNNSQQTQQNATLNFNQGYRDDSLFHAAYSMLKGGMTQDNALICLMILAANCNPPFPEREIKAKIDSALKRISSKERNLTAEIREWVSATFGNFSATNLYQDATIATSEDKHKARTILGRLDAEGIIERIPGKNGWFRRIENDFSVMNLLDAPTEEFKLTLPLELHKKAKFYPGNIIVFAGSKSSAKTAWALNIAKLNMGDVPVDYINSEMGESELRTRLESFKDVSLQKWVSDVHFFEHSREPWDFITKERKLFIIDYLEIDPDKTYMSGAHIKRIHEKLGEGVCIVMLQKDPKKELGRGDTFSIEKARGYFSLDYKPEKKLYQIKIIDVKSPRGTNPRGETLNFKVSGSGSQLTLCGGWQSQG